jgi:hypothetical protein
MTESPLLTVWHICPSGIRSSWVPDYSADKPDRCPCCGAEFVYTTDGWVQLDERTGGQE